MINLKKLIPEKDLLLWETAQKRARFKKHFITYVLVNMFLWGLWFFDGTNHFGTPLNTYPWPLWTTFGWGIGVVLNFTKTYGFTKIVSAENEYKKLLNKL